PDAVVVVVLETQLQVGRHVDVVVTCAGRRLHRDLDGNVYVDDLLFLFVPGADLPGLSPAAHAQPTFRLYPVSVPHGRWQLPVPRARESPGPDRVSSGLIGVDDVAAGFLVVLRQVDADGQHQVDGKYTVLERRPLARRAAVFLGGRAVLQVRGVAVDGRGRFPLRRRSAGRRPSRCIPGQARHVLHRHVRLGVGHLSRQVDQSLLGLFHVSSPGSDSSDGWAGRASPDAGDDSSACARPEAAASARRTACSSLSRKVDTCLFMSVFTCSRTVRGAVSAVLITSSSQPPRKTTSSKLSTLAGSMSLPLMLALTLTLESRLIEQPPFFVV